MAKDHTQRYAESLEKNIESNFNHLKKTVEEFQEMCKVISPEKHIPRDIIVDLHEIYREIQERIKEIKAIQQVLDGRYRVYVRRDPLRDKEILEMRFLAKSCYSRVEYILMQIQEKEKAKEKERTREREKAKEMEQWFRSQENQERFSKYLQTLRSSDHEIPRKRKEEHGGEGAQGQPGGVGRITLVVIKGDSSSLDNLFSRFPWSERDIVDRYGVDELRGALPHIREGNLSEVEDTLQRFAENSPFSELKYLLLHISSLKALHIDITHLVEKYLREMTEGEVKIISI